jgi:hypothetical protein
MTDGERPAHIQAALERLAEDIQQVLGDAGGLIVNPDGMTAYWAIHADNADRLARKVLDEHQAAGDIADYHYESVLDPFTQTMHARIETLHMVPLEEILISLREIGFREAGDG